MNKRIFTVNIAESAVEESLDEKFAFIEIIGSLHDTARRIEDAFHASFSPKDTWEGPYRTMDVFAGEPTLGDVVIVSDRDSGQLKAVPYVNSADGVEFSPRAEWKTVELIYRPSDGDTSSADTSTDSDTDEETSELSELATPIVSILEQDAPADRRAPLSMEVGIIKVGPGNKRDNHYYTREMLERDGKPAFEGLTMHVVDHNEDRRSEQTDVSTVKEVVGVRDMKDGAYLVANVTAYDPDFCEKTRNRAAAGELDKLQCSILAKGSAVTGEVDGQEYNIVQSITEGRFVDWVTRAGAGGKAIALAESDAEPEPEQEPEPAEPPTGDVKEVDIEEAAEAPPQISMHEALNALSKTNLPAGSLVQLAEGTYENTEALETAITAEIDRLKASGSGQPFVNPKQQTPNRKRTRAEIVEAQVAVNSKWLK